MTDFGLGMRLNGTGSVPPSSKYENHSLALANFHSTSASSCHKDINKVLASDISLEIHLNNFHIVHLECHQILFRTDTCMKYSVALNNQNICHQSVIYKDIKLLSLH